MTQWYPPIEGDSLPAEKTPCFDAEYQAQLVVRSDLIVVFLLLLGAGNIGPVRAMAQDSEGNFVELPADEAASPADSEGRDAFLFFPRTAAVEEAASDSFSSLEMAGVTEEESLDSAPSADMEGQSWDAAESFSRSRLFPTIPVQYPLDDSAYEGEDPLGREPASENGGQWRDSSVDRPEEGLSLEERPWMEWHKITVLAQALPSNDKGLGITSLDLKGTLKFSRWPFLFLTPRVGLHSLNGPSTTDLPPQLYDFSVDTTVYLPLNDRWTVQAAATPSLFSDLKAFKNSFRMVGRGLVFYRWSPELQLAGGFVYLGRKDILALPAAGFVYTPNDDLKFDIMFPKPRVSYRYQHNEERERWVYVTGELGGGSWAVERTTGADDVATYRDLQLLLGIEHKQPQALNWQLEGGYAFSRKVEYLSGLGDVELPSSAVLRMVLTF